MANAALGQLIIVAPSPNIGGQGGGDALGKLLMRDYQDGGNMQVAGVVTINNIPMQCKVRLFDQISGRLVREVYSDPVTGICVFPYIRSGNWFVSVYDHNKIYNSDVKSDQQSKPME